MTQPSRFLYFHYSLINPYKRPVILLAEPRVLISGHVYRKLAARGRAVTLRSMRWDDTDRLLAFVNGLADEKQKGRGSDVYTGFEKKLTREEEAEWVSGQLVKLENGDMASVVAETHGGIVGVGQVTRGHYRETRHHGELGLTVLGSHRGLGIGREMIKILLREAKNLGLKSVEVEFLATNQAAAHAYGKAGFRQVGRVPGKVQRSGRLIDSMTMARKI